MGKDLQQLCIWQRVSIKNIQRTNKQFLSKKPWTSRKQLKNGVQNQGDLKMGYRTKERFFKKSNTNVWKTLKCLTPMAIMKMKTKATLRSHLTQLEQPRSIKEMTAQASKDDKNGSLLTDAGSANLDSHYRHQCEVSTNLTIHLPKDLGHTPKGPCILLQRHMLIHVYFWHLHSGVLLSHLKNEIHR